MKTQKRVKTERAFHRGYQIGVQGRSRDICPHGDITARQHWLTGWQEGYSDKINGVLNFELYTKII